MHYIDGYMIAVPTANKAAYLTLATQTAELFKEYGALQVVENWGVDVPDGKLTSMPLAVQKKDDEAVVFSWVVWPSQAVREEGWKRLMQDPRMTTRPDVPLFDGKRMIFGCFEQLLSV
jgi:uncharacterized protein YbaA (DUF1428 family)